MHSKKSSYDQKATGSISNGGNTTNPGGGHANTLNVSGVMNGSGFIVGTNTHTKDPRNTLSMNMFDFAKNQSQLDANTSFNRNEQYIEHNPGRQEVSQNEIGKGGATVI